MRVGLSEILRLRWHARLGSSTPLVLLPSFSPIKQGTRGSLWTTGTIPTLLWSDPQPQV